MAGVFTECRDNSFPPRCYRVGLQGSQSSLDEKETGRKKVIFDLSTLFVMPAKEVSAIYCHAKETLTDERDPEFKNCKG